jgi:hypothetical protein
MLVLGAIVAGTAASVADALPVVDNDGASAQTSVSTPQGLKADGLRLQGIAQAYQQSEQAASAPTAQGLRAYGLSLQGMAQAYQQGQSVAVPDAFERYATAHPYGSGLNGDTGSTLLSRPPDVRDAALAARTVSVSQSSGFDWGDYGIGIGTGMGVFLLLGAGLVVGRQRRHVQTA